MFTARVCETVKEAVEVTKRLLAELDTPRNLEFQAIHSLSETECTEDGGSWNDTAPLISRYLADLDDMHGYMTYDHGGFWDFCPWPEPDPPKSYMLPRHDEQFVSRGEGLVVLYNEFAVCENEYPVIVIKRSLWRNHREGIVKLLQKADPASDYTTKISPAVYIELFFQTQEASCV